jgi:hypothetical protein
MKKSIQNYVPISEDSKFKSWIDDVKAIAEAEGTSTVLDPGFTPTPNQMDEFDANKKHIYAMLRRHGMLTPGSSETSYPRRPTVKRQSR